jgi:phosphoglycolate phosphatase-like HAD superfamily hydrolase
MVERIVVVDFSGTLIKPFVAEEANLKRFALLGIAPPSQADHKQMHGTKVHYDIIKDHIAKAFGLDDDALIRFVQNKGQEIGLRGSEVKTMIMTDLFRNAMYLVAKAHGQQIFTTGIIDTLLAIKSRGYKLAIVSGIRTDIITGMLAITKCPFLFDYIYGQDPILSRDDNQLLVEELTHKGSVTYIIGDKLSDLTPAASVGAKSIFLKGGHPTGGEERFADYVIDDPKRLLELIK